MNQSFPSGLWQKAAERLTFDGPRRTIDAELVRLLCSAGGYVHPLFTDEAHARRTGFAARPLPGQGLLLVLGGLAEQSGIFDDSVIAMVGLDQVCFQGPALAGMTIQLKVELISRQQTSRPDRGIVESRWIATNEEDAELVTSVVRFLVHTGDHGSPGP